MLLCTESEEAGMIPLTVGSLFSRIATGQKDRVNRLKALGNAICPQVAQFVGQCLLDSIEMEATQ